MPRNHACQHRPQVQLSYSQLLGQLPPPPRALCMSPPGSPQSGRCRTLPIAPAAGCILTPGCSAPRLDRPAGCAPAADAWAALLQAADALQTCGGAAPSAARQAAGAAQLWQPTAGVPLQSSHLSRRAAYGAAGKARKGTHLGRSLRHQHHHSHHRHRSSSSSSRAASLSPVVLKRRSSQVGACRNSGAVVQAVAPSQPGLSPFRLRQEAEARSSSPGEDTAAGIRTPACLSECTGASASNVGAAPSLAPSPHHQTLMHHLVSALAPREAALLLAQHGALLLPLASCGSAGAAPDPLPRPLSPGLLDALPVEEACRLHSARSFLAQF